MMESKKEKLLRRLLLDNQDDSVGPLTTQEVLVCLDEELEKDETEIDVEFVQYCIELLNSL